VRDEGERRGTQVARVLCLSCATVNLESTLCRTSTGGNAYIAEQDVKTLLFTPSAEQSLEASILMAARAHECSTVVVGREAFSWLKELFQAHVADKLIPQAGDLTLWIVQ
jgi:hypothetical protein